MSSSSVISQPLNGNGGSGGASSAKSDGTPEPFATLFRNIIAAQKILEECNKKYSELQAQRPCEQENSNEDEKQQKRNKWIHEAKVEEVAYNSFEAQEEILKWKRSVWEGILNPSIDPNCKELVRGNFPWVAMCTGFGSSPFDLIKASSDFSSKKVTKAVAQYIVEFGKQQEQVKQLKEDVGDLLKRIKTRLETSHV